MFIFVLTSRYLLYVDASLVENVWQIPPPHDSKNKQYGVKCPERDLDAAVFSFGGKCFKVAWFDAALLSNMSASINMQQVSFQSWLAVFACIVLRMDWTMAIAWGLKQHPMNAFLPKFKVHCTQHQLLDKLFATVHRSSPLSSAMKQTKRIDGKDMTPE